MYSLPSLTTVDPGRAEIAEVAVRSLMERIEGSDAVGAPRLHLAQFRIVERESTATR